MFLIYKSIEGIKLLAFVLKNANPDNTLHTTGQLDMWSIQGQEDHPVHISCPTYLLFSSSCLLMNKVAMVPNPTGSMFATLTTGPKSCGFILNNSNQIHHGIVYPCMTQWISLPSHSRNWRQCALRISILHHGFASHGKNIDRVLLLLLKMIVTLLDQISPLIQVPSISNPRCTPGHSISYIPYFPSPLEQHQHSISRWSCSFASLWSWMV